MEKKLTPSNPFDLPEIQQFWARFTDAINDRAFSQCRELLQDRRRASQITESQNFCSYCEAILYSEQNRWDKSESILQILLLRPLHPAFQMRVVNVLAITYEHLGRLEEASDLYFQALDTAQQTGERDFWARDRKSVV